jgi:hypothetical protein
MVCFEIVLILTQDSCTVCADRIIGSEIILDDRMELLRAQFAPNVPKAQKSFWTNPMVHLGEEAQLEACFGGFRDSANLDTR